MYWSTQDTPGLGSGYKPWWVWLSGRFLATTTGKIPRTPTGLMCESCASPLLWCAYCACCEYCQLQQRVDGIAVTVWVCLWSSWQNILLETPTVAKLALSGLSNLLGVYMSVDRCCEMQPVMRYSWDVGCSGKNKQVLIIIKLPWASTKVETYFL